MTCEEVADQVECSPSKISRMETGQVSIHPRDVRELADLYGATEEQTAALITIAREARKQGWWHSYFGVLPKLYLTFIGLEAEAACIMAYEPQLVPGLAQTEAYARALKDRDPLRTSPAENEQFIAARLARQGIISGESPHSLVAVLDEAVIRRSVGGAKVMHDQLLRLLSVMDLPNVTIRVIPFSAGAHPAMEGQFTILEFPDELDPDIIYIETLTSSIFLEREEEIVRYRMVFDQVLDSALSPAASRTLVSEAARALE
jgi:hypothetical protein